MNRRELLKQIALLTGGAVVGAEVLLTGCKSGPATEVGFTAGNIALLDEVGETILPATSTPGAKAVRIGEFMKTIVNDCYEEADQQIFHAGIGKLDKTCRDEKGKSFMECTPQERHDVLVGIDKIARDHQKRKSDLEKQDKEVQQKEQVDEGSKTPPPEERQTHYFTMMKQLTLWGYFTSKEGVMQALRYVPVPGKYEGCVDYKKGDKIQVGLDG